MASSTARVLIADALRSLGVLSAGETPTSDEADDALMLLNEMLEQWNLQSLLVYSFLRTAQNTVASTASYTLGSGGDWNMTRPDRIERIVHYDSSSDLEIPLIHLSERQFQRLTTKSTESTIPGWWYDNRAFPLRTITLWPVPSENSQVYLYTWQALTTVATLDTTLNFPPGYRAAVRYNLALHAAVDFGQPATQELLLQAREAIKVVKRANTVPEPLRIDPAIGGVISGDFDAELGDYRW